jgi:hypothetical protein
MGRKTANKMSQSIKRVFPGAGRMQSSLHLQSAMIKRIDQLKGGWLPKIAKTNKYLACSLLIIAAYIAPLIIFWDNSPIVIFDNLDSCIVWYKVLADSGQLFGSLNATIPQIMNGIPRNDLGSEFNVIQWLYLLFDPYLANVLNIAIMHFIAFIGMYLLLKRHILDESEDRTISLGVATSFALLPFWPPGGLSIAGMPLLFYSFFNIRENKWRMTDWAILVFIPFYSNFAWAGFFIIVSLGIILISDAIRTRKLNKPFTFAIISMLVIYCICEYRLIYSMFFDAGYISHRTEFDIINHFNLIQALKSSLDIFIFGQFHAASLQKYFIGISVIIAFGALFIKRVRNDRLVILVTIAAMIALFYGFWHWDKFVMIRGQVMIGKTFQFDRFYFLYPLLWYLIFGLALKTISNLIKHGRQIAWILLALQIVFLFTLNGDSYQSGGMGNLLDNGLSFKEFYSTQLFTEIKNAIGENPKDYRVVSIGIYPAIALFNGFYALDSYQNNYPLQYKHEFRKIMANELIKSERYRIYFDNWGSRCNIFASELDNNFINLKDSNNAINNLSINTKILHDMGGKYIISAVNIKNAEANRLKLMGIFENSNSPWKIWLYSVHVES